MSDQPEPHWPFANKVLFRFFFIFFIPLPWVVRNMVPYYEKEIIAYISGFGDWIKKTLLNIHTVSIPYMGDKTEAWVLVGTCLVLSIVGCAMWSILDRRRNNYQTLHILLRIYLRYYVAIVMLAYGFWKVIPLQFRFPNLYFLNSEVGDLSPTRLLWLMMGYSVPYVVFTGLAEVIGGTLLFFRRTTTLGALILLGTLGNVVMLNFSYDVDVKLLSSTLLLMTLFLLVPEIHRVADFFLFNNPVKPLEHSHYFSTKRAQRIRVATKVLVIFFSFFYFYYGAWESWEYYYPTTRKTKLFGTYDVKEFRLQNNKNTLATADSLVWRQIVFNEPYADNATVVLIKRMWSNDWFLCGFDSLGNVMSLTHRADSTKNIKAHFFSTDSTTYSVHGVMGQDSLFALLRKNEKPFRLVTHGFHWIPETPW